MFLCRLLLVTLGDRSFSPVLQTRKGRLSKAELVAQEHTVGLRLNQGLNPGLGLPEHTHPLNHSVLVWVGIFVFSGMKGSHVFFSEEQRLSKAPTVCLDRAGHRRRV